MMMIVVTSSKDDLMMIPIYKKGLFGFGAGVMLAVNAATPVQGFPPESIIPGFSEMNGLGAAANRSLLLSDVKNWEAGGLDGEVPKGLVECELTGAPSCFWLLSGHPTLLLFVSVLPHCGVHIGGVLAACVVVLPH